MSGTCLVYHAQVSWLTMYLTNSELGLNTSVKIDVVNLQIKRYLVDIILLFLCERTHPLMAKYEINVKVWARILEAFLHSTPPNITHSLIVFSIVMCCGPET